MVVNINTNQAYKSIPDSFKTTLSGYKELTDQHYEDGFRDLVVPELLENEKLTDWYYDKSEDKCFYNKETLSPEEVVEKLTIESKLKRQDLIQQKLETQVLDTAQSVKDDEALEQKDLYPFWSDESVSYDIDFKVLDFTSDNELALYKVVQGHTSQSDWQPRNTPALFTRIQLDEVLDWVQPSGAHDAYQVGDQVIYPSGSAQVWESKVNANVFAPGVVIGQWIKV